MKLLLSVFALLVSALVIQAANPAFQDFYGTNGILIRTNGNKVQVDGSLFAGGTNVLIRTNGTPVGSVGTLNFTTGVTGYQAGAVVNLGIEAGSGVTTGTVANANIWTNQNGRIRPIVYPTFRIYPTNDDAASPILIMGGAGASNWMAAGYGGTLRDYSLFSANIVEEGDLNNRNLAVASAQDTGGARYGYAAFETKTNQSMVFTETLITGGGVNRFIAGHVDGTGNTITLVTNTTEAFKVDGAGGISLMKAVPQNWPDAQGAAATVLTNDGSGNLGWGTVSAGAAGVTTNDLIHTNVTWVAKNGNNATGVPGNFARPYLSISNAVQASPAGTLVVVEPGLYNESVRFKNGVNFYMPSGVIVSQSVNLAVFFDSGSTVTSRLAGDFKIIHTGDGSQTDGINCFGEDTDITIDRVTIDVVGSSDYGINMERGSVKAAGTIYSSDHGIGSERLSGTGIISFTGEIYTTNNAAFITGGTAGSNYIKGVFSSELYHAIQHTLGFLLVEESEVITYSPTHRAIDFQNDNMELRGTKVTAVGEEAIGKYGNGFLILDDVQLIGGTNTTYSIDNADDTSNGTTELRTPIWANLPIRPDMIMTSNGFTRLSRYLSITTNDYQFPAVQGAAGTVLTNDGAGVLGWGSVGGSGTPGGTTPMIQMNMGGAFVGTTNFLYDVTNSFLTLGIPITRRPIVEFEIGGGQPKLYMGGSTFGNFTNVMSSDYFGSLNNYVAISPRLQTAGTLAWYADTNAFTPGEANAMDVGAVDKTLRSNVTMNAWVSNTFVFLGGTLGAGNVLTDPLGNGSATWGTNVGNLLVTNLTVVNNFTGKGDVYVTNLFLGGVNLRTNQYTTNISDTPVKGSFWFGGTFGTDVTNGSRTSMEWIPQRHSFRIGALGPNASVSNYWDSTNVGSGSFAQGSNVLAVGHYSAVHGIFNRVGTNSGASSIMGGSNNVILTNVFSGHIAGGHNNDIGDNHHDAFIGAGLGNSIDTVGIGSVGASVIVGGDNNRVRLHYGAIVGGAGNDVATIGSFIGGGINHIANSGDYIAIVGGEGNIARGDWSFIGGGNGNTVTANATGADALASVIAGGRFNTIGSGTTGGDYSFIGGGRSNLVMDLADYCAIGGGSFNQTGGGGNAVNGNTIAGGFNNITDDQIDFASIGGGMKNSAVGDFGFIPGGVSNRITAAFASASGNFITNSTTKSVEIGQGDAGGNNRKARVDVNGLKVLTYGGHAAAVGGTILVTNTPIASAGAAETNLQVVTIGAHVLTNNNERLLVRASGRFAATSNAKEVKLVFGSQEVFASGSQVANTGAWTLDAEIIRTGNTSQSVNASFHGGTNTAFITESSLDLSQTNGIATVLKITGTAAGDGDITNRTLTVEWRPSI